MSNRILIIISGLLCTGCTRGLIHAANTSEGLTTITFNTASAFHEFVYYALEKGLAYKATEVGGEYVVYVTGY